MRKLAVNDPETRSADIITDNIKCLKELFPDVFTEGRINFDVLPTFLPNRHI
jgi:adenine-specific DNA-methyltransferase